MKKYFYFPTLLLLVVLSTQKSFSQDTIAAEVFTIPTCDPVNSIIQPGGKNITVRKPVRLEAKSRIASVLRITGINPLRYKYFINNQAVTQFMESSPLTFSLGTFTEGSYFATAPEIKVPEIFKTDSVFSKTKQTIKEFQSKIKFHADSITLLDSQLEEIWFDVINSETNKTKWNSVYQGKPEVKSLTKRLNRNTHLHDRIFKEYQMFTGGLSLNNPRFGLLDLYDNIDLDSSKGIRDIDSIKKYKKLFAKDYNRRINDFKKINDFLFTLETNDRYKIRINYDTDQVFLQLKEELRKYNFIWLESASSTHRKWENELAQNIRDVKEQILNKQFQIWEEFVLNTATRIGVFIQKQFREYSSYNNALENYTCITPETIDSVRSQRKKLITSFEFIQQTNAELQTLVPYLDINTELYQSIARKINANYVFLLSYLKNLDYASQENSIQYTLPTHSNLKNIDLIRYTVKREDKITKNTQEYNYDFWLKGGIKIDFSLGFFATRLTDNVYNKVLLDTAGGIDKIRITRQDDGRASFSFGGMVNLVPRNGAKWLNVGGSIGVAYSDNKTLQVLTAASFHFGKTERLILHAGAGFGTIKYLDISANDFKFNDRTDMSKIVTRENLQDIKEKDRVYMLQSPDIKFTSFTIPTVNKFVIRPFIGITYNLSKKNALQAVSGTGATTFSDNYNNIPSK